MFKNELQELTDKDLMRLSWIAQEQRIGKWIKAIRNEMNRRNKEL